MEDNDGASRICQPWQNIWQNRCLLITQKTDHMPLLGDVICNSYGNDMGWLCWLPLVIYDKKELARFQIEMEENGEGLGVKDCF